MVVLLPVGKWGDGFNMREAMGALGNIIGLWRLCIGLAGWLFGCFDVKGTGEEIWGFGYVSDYLGRGT